MKLITLAATSLLAVNAFAQESIDFWPGADYDPSVPTVESVLGHTAGERITWHADAIRYFEALEAARPDQVTIHRYAQTWEGRDLIYVVVSSAENMARIDGVKSGMQQLRNAGSTSGDAANRIIASQPAVTWLSYGVHGNEISSTDAAMLTAYHLLASRGDARAADILRESVVVIDPMQNPDGRDRFIHHFEMSEGLEPNSDRLSAEHNEPWPGGRTNHYLFDMNRDWFILTQPETRGRIDALQEWFPVAFVDLHEMGSNSTYYFAPEAVPFNPHLAADQRASLELFGKTNARWFDHFGLDYFTREVYDAFYPGYGASWPSYFGSIAMTYEQASSRGLVVRKYDGVEMTYAETVRNHFVTSLGTAETVASNREKFLRDFYDYQRSAIAEGGSEDIRAYILPTQRDQAGADKLAGLLTRQGVQVGVASEGFRACGTSYAAGSYVINLAQPAKRLVRTLMDADVPIDPEFMEEQERRRAKGLPDEIYDTTAWSLPLMMNIESQACSRAVSVATTPATSQFPKPGSVGGRASVSYLVPWGEATSVRFLSNALRDGMSVKSSDKAFTHQGREYPAGTLIIDVADNAEGIHASIAEIAESAGANVVAVDDSWVSDGPNFGSENVVRFNAPRVAIAWDRPTSSYSAGNTRFVIERQFDYPVTPIRTQQIGGADLARFQVLILPEAWGGGYGGTLGEEGLANLKAWVSKGGVLIAVGNANRWLADANIDLTSIRRENRVVESDDDDKKGGGNGKGDGDGEEKDPTVEGSYLTSAEDLEKAITPEKDDPDSMGGVLVNASVDPDHWLGAGVASNLHVLVRGTDIYTPIKLDKGVNVARYESADDLLASGYIWEENRKQLAFKPFVVVQPEGRGFVISFTQDPNVRAYLDGLNVIFMNAIFRGSAHARPNR